MTPGKLEQEEKKADDLVSTINDELIAAGRGHELASETRDLAKKGDELAKRWVEAADARSDLVQERQRRVKYHGNTKRIKKARGGIMNDSASATRVVAKFLEAKGQITDTVAMEPPKDWMDKLPE